MAQDIGYFSRHASEGEMLQDDIRTWLGARKWVVDQFKICGAVENNIGSVCIVGEIDEETGEGCWAIVRSFDESEERQPAKIQADLVAELITAGYTIYEFFYVKNEIGEGFVFITNNIK